MAGRVRADDVRAYPRHARSLSARAVRQRMFVLGLLLAVVAIASVVTVPGIVHHHRAAPDPPLSRAAEARNEAAAWVRRWVAPGSTVACDPVMCSVLLFHGVGVGQLFQLNAAATDPLGSSVVVVTPVLRSQLGSRLASVYAPDVLASFGKGSAQVVIRVVASDGSAAYEIQLRSDWDSRKAAGKQLLDNSEISATPAAAADLSGGEVDSRLLIILPVLVQICGPVRILRFGGAGPGRSRGVPLLAAYITPASRRAAMVSAAARIAAFLKAQWTAIKAASFSERTSRDGQIIVQLDATSPPQFGEFSGNPVLTTPIAGPSK